MCPQQRLHVVPLTSQKLLCEWRDRSVQRYICADATMKCAELTKLQEHNTVPRLGIVSWGAFNCFWHDSQSSKTPCSLKLRKFQFFVFSFLLTHLFMLRLLYTKCFVVRETGLGWMARNCVTDCTGPKATHIILHFTLMLVWGCETHGSHLSLCFTDMNTYFTAWSHANTVLLIIEAYLYIFVRFTLANSKKAQI